MSDSRRLCFSCSILHLHCCFAHKNLPSTKLSSLYSFFQTNSKSYQKCFGSSKAPLGACRRRPPNGLCGRATSLTELLHFSLSICSRDTTCRVSVGWSCRCSHSNSSHSTLNNQSASPADSPAVAAGGSMRDKSACKHTHTDTHCVLSDSS